MISREQKMVRNMRQAFTGALFGVLAGCLVTTAGCDREGVHAYRAPKEAAKSVPGPDASGEVTWTVPEGWRVVENSQPMRVATLRTAGDAGIDVAISAFPGESGGLLDNVNRWRGQLGLPAAEAKDLPDLLQTTNENGVEVSTLSLTGSQGQQMLGAIIDPGDGKTWFVKATADPKAAEAIRAAFDAFARSFRHSASSSAAPATGPAGPVPMPPMSGTDEVGARLAAWTPPPHWKREADNSGILASAFAATNADGGARATVTSLLNDGGGVLANINRWRDQLGLAPVETLAQQPTKDLGKGGIMVDLADAAASRRMVAAIIAVDGRSWFFKLTGTVKGVEAELADFERLARVVGQGEQ